MQIMPLDYVDGTQALRSHVQNQWWWINQGFFFFFFSFMQMKDTSLQKNGTDPHQMESRVVRYWTSGHAKAQNQLTVIP